MTRGGCGEDSRRRRRCGWRTKKHGRRVAGSARLGSRVDYKPRRPGVAVYIQAAAAALGGASTTAVTEPLTAVHCPATAARVPIAPPFSVADTNQNSGRRHRYNLLLLPPDYFRAPSAAAGRTATAHPPSQPPRAEGGRRARTPTHVHNSQQSFTRFPSPLLFAMISCRFTPAFHVSYRTKTRTYYTYCLYTGPA